MSLLACVFSMGIIMRLFAASMDVYTSVIISIGVYIGVHISMAVFAYVFINIDAYVGLYIEGFRPEWSISAFCTFEKNEFESLEL